MPSQIRPNRPEVNDRFPMLGFTIRTDGEKKRYEVAVAADVSLFRQEAKSKRSRSNFYSSRACGLQPISSGEAVYVLPAEVLARFVGQGKLYYALVTYANGPSNAEISTLPAEGSPYVNLSGLTGRSLKRVRVLPTRQDASNSYGSGSDLEWGGDVSLPGSQPVAEHRTNGGSNGNAASATSNPVNYTDGFGPMPAPSTSTPPTAQAASFVSPLEVVEPDYVPSNAQDSLRMQLEFQNRYDQWMAGVSNTSFFPHSAICRIVRDDGGAGTGFYIGPNHLLTAAHVVEEANSLTIIPGKNGGADLSGPFGNCRVSSSNWTIHPARNLDNHDFDLAVISVPDPPPMGFYFGILEELRQSLPSSIIVCGYSAASKTRPDVTSKIDRNRQHLDGDRIRLVADETFQYNLQTLAGASGAPVYYAWVREDDERQMSVVELHLVGVHVSGFSDSLNSGCRLTDDKIRWIRSVMGPASILTLGTEPAAAENEGDGPGIEGGIPDDDTNLVSAQAYTRALEQTPEYPQASRFAPAAPVNYRAWRDPRPINRVVIHINDGGSKVSGTVGWFQNPHQRNSQNKPITVSAHYVVGQDGEVVQMVRHNDQAWHAGSANRDSIGIEHIANPRGLMPSEAEYCASAALVRWLCDTYNIPIDRTHILGHSEADPQTTHTDCPNSVWNWDYYMQLVQSATSAPQAQAAALAEDTSDPVLPPPPPPRARAMDGGVTVAIASTIAGAAMERLLNDDGDVNWSLDQLLGLKHPNDVPPNPMPGFHDAQTIRLVDWPYIDSKIGDRIQAKFSVDWQFNGVSLGNVRIGNIGTEDAIGWGLKVEARIMNDAILHGPAAALRINFNFRFTRAILSDKIATIELRLFADGTFSYSSNWEQQ